MFRLCSFSSISSMFSCARAARVSIDRSRDSADATPSACGTGQAAMGPFYCPSDQGIYIDTDFYREMEQQQFAHPDRLDAAQRDQWLVLRGGIRLEQFWIDWITDYLQAHAKD